MADEILSRRDILAMNSPFTVEHAARACGWSGTDVNEVSACDLTQEDYRRTLLVVLASLNYEHADAMISHSDHEKLTELQSQEPADCPDEAEPTSPKGQGERMSISVGGPVMTMVPRDEYYEAFRQCSKRYALMARGSDFEQLVADFKMMAETEDSPIGSLNRVLGRIQGLLVALGRTTFKEESDFFSPLFRPLDHPMWKEVR